MKKGGIKISTLLISIVFVALFATVFSNFYAGVADRYPVTYDSDINNTLSIYNQFDTIRNTSESVQEQLYKNNTGLAASTDLLGTFLGSGFYVLKLASQSIIAIGIIGYEAGDAMNLPSYFIAMILLIPVILLIFALISALVGKDL